MGTSLGAGSCVTLGSLLLFFGQESQVLSCSCVISARVEVLALFLVFVFGNEYPLICGLEECSVRPAAAEARFTL